MPNKTKTQPKIDFEAQLVNESYWRDVFGPDNEPKKFILPGSRYITLPGWFPTTKNIRGEVRTREPLMADLLIHLDTDPMVRVIAEFPIVEPFVSHNARGKVNVSEHIPDLAVLRTDGSVFVIDVMTYHVRKTMRDAEQRRIDLTHHYEKKGAKYLLLDETTIRLQPLFFNLRLMWKHKHSKHEPAGMEAVRTSLREASYPTTIEALIRSMPTNAIFARWGDEPESAARHVTENNPTFSAVMQLAISGELEVNLDKKFSANTIVTRKETAHA